MKGNPMMLLVAVVAAWVLLGHGGLSSCGGLGALGGGLGGGGHSHSHSHGHGHGHGHHHHGGD